MTFPFFVSPALPVSLYCPYVIMASTTTKKTLKKHCNLCRWQGNQFGNRQFALVKNVTRQQVTEITILGNLISEYRDLSAMTNEIVHYPQPPLRSCQRQTTTCLPIPKKTEHFCFNQWLLKKTNHRKKSKRKRKSLFVNEDKSNASILHAITISLTTPICKIFPEKRDHLTPICDGILSFH